MPYQYIKVRDIKKGHMNYGEIRRRGKKIHRKCKIIKSFKDLLKRISREVLPDYVGLCSCFVLIRDVRRCVRVCVSVCL